MRFSVITPSFRQLDWLRLAVASVADQTDPSLGIEHIIQDGGTPGIEAFAQEIGASFYREDELVFSAQPGTSSHEPRTTNHEPASTMKVFTEEDAGMYDAINKGLDRSSGGLLAYLNCDEQYLPGTLRSVAQHFVAHPKVEVVFADALLLDAEGTALSYRRTVLPDRWHTRLCHLNTLTCSTFFRRSILENGFRFPSDKKIIGDAVWVDALLASNTAMDYLRMPTSTFAFTGGNLSELDSGNDGEQARWLEDPETPPRWLRAPVSCWHRVKKLLAGAYRRRSLEYRIYTHEQPAQRRLFHANNLGGGWPGQTL